MTDTLARVSATCGGVLLLCLSFLVAADVLLRNFLKVTVGGADEISGYAFAIGTSWALSYTLLMRGHVRIDVIYTFLPKRTKAVLDLMSVAAMLLVGLGIAYLGQQVLQKTLQVDSHSNTPLSTPLWIPQLLWLAGLVLFLWSLTLLFFRGLIALLAGDYEGATSLLGVPNEVTDLGKLES